MQKVAKISLAKQTCSDAVITINKPVLTTTSPICPFEFYVESSNFSGSAGVTHTSTIWELSISATFEPGSTVTTIETIDNKTAVLFPKKFIKEDTDYYLRAYFVTDKGEGAYSDIVAVTTRFTSLQTADGVNLGSPNSTDIYSSKVVINQIGTDVYALMFNPNSKKFEIHRRNATDWSATFLADYNGGVANLYWYPGIQNDLGSADIIIATSCINGTDIYYTISLFVYADGVGSLASINLVKFDTVSNQFTTLLADNTGLFKRDLPGMHFYNNALYFVGGYRVTPAGIGITPDDAERTFIKFDLATSQLSEVTVTGDSKPRNYRDMKIIPYQNGFFTFSGKGSPNESISSLTYSPEFWYWSFTKSAWEAMRFFPVPNDLFGTIFSATLDPNETSVNLVTLTDTGNVRFWKYWISEKIWEPIGKATIDVASLSPVSINMNGYSIIIAKNETGS